MNLTLIKDEYAVVSACQEIKSFGLIALDLEGKSLGQKEGEISLIQIALENGRVYLFDLAGCNKLHPYLKKILEDESIKKFMFDCRADSSALYYYLSTRLKGILDLQLQDVFSRNDSTEKSRRRLHGPLYWKSVEGNKDIYKDVIRINSFSNCLKEHNIATDDIKQYISQQMRLDTRFWMECLVT
jgi:hypothetical protein